MKLTVHQQRILGCTSGSVDRCWDCLTTPQFRINVIGTADFDCPHGHTVRTLPSRGLGDTVAKLTNAVGIPACGGCKSRQKKFNKTIPYKDAKQ